MSNGVDMVTGNTANSIMVTVVGIIAADGAGNVMMTITTAAAGIIAVGINTSAPGANSVRSA